MRRRRGLVLLALALASGGLAASQVHGRVEAVERRVGPLVPVAVAARDLPADATVGTRALEVRRVPERFVPPDAVASPAAAAGLRTAVPVAAGSYLTVAHLEGAGAPRSGPRLRHGERALELSVSGGEDLARAGPGARVDVLVSTEPRGGYGRTLVALEDVELLALRRGGAGRSLGPSAGPAAAGAATARATVRVTLRQAVYLAAAESFAREVRLLARPPGDRARVGGAAVSARDL